MLTAYTARQAQLLDPHCDMLLVGDSLGQVIYGLPSSVPVTLDMMAAHGAAVVRGSYHSAVVIDMPFGSYEASPAQAFESASRLMKETGAAGVKLEGGAAMAETIAFLSARGVPVCGHVGLTPQAINMLGGYGPRGRDAAEAAGILADARAVADAGCFAMVIEGVLPELAETITAAVPCPTIGIGASAKCDGQVLVTEDLLGLFERTPRFVKRYANPRGHREPGRRPTMPARCVPVPSRDRSSSMGVKSDLHPVQPPLRSAPAQPELPLPTPGDRIWP